MEKEKIIAKEFSTESAMMAWLADPKNLDELKSKYPPAKYKADLQLIDKQVVITEK